MRFDAPSLRAARVGYPVVVWLMTRPRPSAIPWVMVIVNIIAAAIAVGATARTLALLGAPQRRSLLVLLLPAVNYGISMDLSDPLALALVAIGIERWLRKRPVAAAIALTCAVFVRESTLAVPAILLLTELLDRRAPRQRGPAHVSRTPLLLAIAPVVSYLALQIWVAARFGSTGLLTSGSANLRAPLATLISEPSLLVPRDATSALRVFSLASLVALFTIAASAMWRWGSEAASGSHGERRIRRATLIAAFGGLLLLVSQARVLLFQYRNLSRAAGEFEYLALLGLAVRFDHLPRVTRLAARAVAVAGLVLVAWSVKSATLLR